MSAQTETTFTCQHACVCYQALLLLPWWAAHTPTLKTGCRFLLFILLLRFVAFGVNKSCRRGKNESRSSLLTVIFWVPVLHRRVTWPAGFNTFGNSSRCRRFIFLFKAGITSNLNVAHKHGQKVLHCSFSQVILGLQPSQWTITNTAELSWLPHTLASA